MSKDLFSAHASDYAKYRPRYPIGLIEYIASFAEKKECVLDCATGNGQAAVLLTHYFKKVFATDLSQKQIEAAEQDPAITYSVSPAESTEFADNSFDAINVAQAYHWLNHKKFSEEAKRIGRSGAIVSVIGYNLFRCENKEVTKLVDSFYYNITDPYWEPERRYVENLYKDAPFYFDELPVENTFRMEVPWTIDHVQGYINTWSAIKKFIRQNGFNPVDELMERIKKVWGQKEVLEFNFPLALRIGKISK
jgi:ubiquinone/menaquinone biosynthesis C-methylase UbiE